MNLEYIPAFLEAAKAGGVVLREYFGKNLAGKEKTHRADVQTEADLAAEAAIMPILNKAFPTFDIHAEENGRTRRDSEYTIVIDPLDGTHNFVLGIPNFTIIIALLYKKRAVAGLIYHPMINQSYYAEEGKGAFCDGAPIHVSNEPDSSKAVVAYVPGYNNAGRQVGPVASALFGDLTIKRFLYSWSSAADGCLLAAGRIGAMIYDGNEIYDYAASKVICREAGAKITDINGNPEPDDMSNVFLISNGTSLHEKVLESWKRVRE